MSAGDAGRHVGFHIDGEGARFLMQGGFISCRGHHYIATG